MRTTIILAALLIFLFAATTYSANGQYYFKFEIKDRKELAELTRIISIDNVKDFTVWAYANEKEMAEFRTRGYEFEILPDPGSLIVPRMSSDKAGIMEWDTYPTYSAYVQMMQDYATDYPSLCILDTIGYSEENRLLLACKISDNVATEEDEPEVMYTATMHGDETAGYVLMLRLINYLLENYGSDAQVNNMVDNMEIWINPQANPDGTYAGGEHTVNGATRRNANNVDLNRNYPDPKGGPHPDGNGWQDETVAFMAWAEAHRFAISANFHGGAEVVNYPWDTWSTRHADDDWYQYISHKYADSCHANSPSGYMDGSGFDNGITNGWDWYSIEGGRQDYMNYWHGCREVTLEISNVKLLPASQLPAHWDYNRAALLEWLENGLDGVRGIVTDAVSGDPLLATVNTIGHDVDSARIFTDPDIGDYHRMLEPGTYDLEFVAPGYYPDTVKNVVVAYESVVVHDVQLQPLPAGPQFAFQSHDANNIQPDDAVQMNVTLVNNGIDDGTGVSAQLSTSDSYITITQGAASFPDITALGGTGTSLTAFQFDVSPSTPMLHLINFMLVVTASGGFDDTVYFSVLVGQEIEAFESGDFATYDWQMGGNQNWVITSGGVEGGSFAAGSGDISDDQTSELYIDVEVQASGEISFYYKVSSESTWDWLEFYLDGNRLDRWSGNVDWTQTSFQVTAGQHTFKWVYDKDGSLSSGSDRGWIDYIVFPPLASGITITTSDVPDWTADQPYSFQLEAQGGTGLLTWSDLNSDLAGTGLELSTSGLLTGTPSSAGLINFTSHVEDEQSASADRPFSFTINPAVAITTTSMPSGTEGEAYSYQLVSSGGTGTITWSDLDSDLAANGLALSSSGLVSGTPTTSGTCNFTAVAGDGTGSSDQQPLSVEIAAAYICGDADGNGIVEISDAVFLLTYVFVPGSPAPDPIEAGDVDCNEIIEVTDAVYLINYVLVPGSPEPCADCP